MNSNDEQTRSQSGRGASTGRGKQTSGSAGGGAGDEYEEELRILERAHQVLMRKKGAQQARARDADRNATESYADFINYTTVKEMMDDIVAPVLEQMPLMRDKMTACQTELLSVKGQTRQISNEMGQMREKLREVEQFHVEMQRVRSAVQLIEQTTEERCTELKQADRLMETVITDFEDRLILHDKKLKEYSSRIEESRQKQQANHDQQTTLFDQWHVGLGNEVKKLSTAQTDLQNLHAQTQQNAKMFARQIQETVDRTVGELTARLQEDLSAFARFEGRVKKVETRLLGLNGLQRSVDELQRQATKADYQPKFLTNTLPLLIHLTVCEALDKVVGDDYRSSLADFEKFKLDEIHSYANHSSGGKCLYVMHTRLATLLKFFHRQGKGVLPFVYGKDVSDELPYEEITYVNQQYERILAKKAESQANREADFRDALEQAMLGADKSSDIVFQHKLERLEPYQIAQLRNKVLQLRILRTRNFADVMVHPPAPRQLVRADPAADKPKQPPQAVTVHLPKELVVFQREAMRPYQRLERKYSRLFAMAQEDLRAFKANAILNFSKMTQMTLQLDADVGVVKGVVQNIQNSFEEFDDKVTNNQHRLVVQVEEVNERLEKANKVIGRNWAEHQKCVRFTEELEERLLDATRLIMADQGEIRALDGEIAGVKEAMQENSKQLQAELTRQKKMIMENMNKAIGLQDELAKTRTRSEVREIKHNIKDKVGQAVSMALAKGKGNEALRINAQPTVASGGAGEGELDGEIQVPDSAVCGGDPPASEGSSPNSQPRSPHNIDTTGDRTKQSAEPQGAKGPAKGQRQAPHANKAAKLSQKDKDKQLKQQKLDEKRRKEEAAEKRRKDREEKAERDRIEGEEKAAEEEKAKEAEARRLQAEADLQDKIAERQELMRKLQVKSKCLALSHRFLSSLGDQKVEGEMMEARIHHRAKGRGGRHGQLALGRKSRTEPPRGDDGGQSHTAVRHGARLDDILDDDEEYQSCSDEDDDKSPRFVNPFAQIFAKNKLAKETLTLGKLEEHLRPKLEGVYARIKEADAKIDERVGKLADQVETKLAGQIQESLKDIKSLWAEKDKMAGVVDEVTWSFKEFQEKMGFEHKELAGRIDQDKTELSKMRRDIRQEIQSQVDRIKDHDADAGREFKRLNAYTEANHKLMTTLLEDSMLSQMLQEQEIIDRKQIGLFGLKTNQQILGTNQYSISNNLSPARDRSSIGERVSGSGPAEKGESKGFWDMRNKKREYNKIVKRPIKTGQSSRGQDHSKTQNDSEILGNLNQSVVMQTLGQDGSPPTQRTQENSQRQHASLFNEAPIFSPKASQITNQPASIINDSSKLLASRLAASTQHPYNTLFVDRNCATCMTGQLPQVLSSIRMACLSYVNSPIKYGIPSLTSKNKGRPDMMDLQFSDIIQIKEFLLLKCQGHMKTCQAVMDESGVGFAAGPVTPKAAGAKLNPKEAKQMFRKEETGTAAVGRGSIDKQKFRGKRSPDPSRGTAPPLQTDEATVIGPLESLDQNKSGIAASEAFDGFDRLTDGQNDRIQNARYQDDKIANHGDKVKHHIAVNPLEFHGDDNRSGSRSGPNAIDDRNQSPPKIDDQQAGKFHNKALANRVGEDIESDGEDGVHIKMPDAPASKYHIPILVDLIMRKKWTQDNISIRNYMKDLVDKQMERQAKRVDQSAQLKRKTNRLQHRQAFEQERKRMNIIVDDPNEGVYLQQKQNNAKKANIKKMVPALDRSSLREDPLMSCSVHVHPVNNADIFSSILRNSSQAPWPRDAGLQLLQKRPGTVAGDGTTMSVQVRNNQRQKRNQTVLSAYQAVQSASRMQHGPTTPQNATDSFPAEEDSQLPADLTETSLQNSIWPRTTKNTRYETLHGDQGTVSNDDNIHNYIGPALKDISSQHISNLKLDPGAVKVVRKPPHLTIQ